MSSPSLTAAPPAVAPALMRSRMGLPETGVWDELRTSDGAWRDAWQRFSAQVPVAREVDTSTDLDRRRQAIEAQIRRDGVTHNVFGPEGAVARPWSLELLPLLIEQLPTEPKVWHVQMLDASHTHHLHLMLKNNSVT
jgi:hypothetical protein